MPDLINKPDAAPRTNAVIKKLDELIEFADSIYIGDSMVALSDPDLRTEVGVKFAVKQLRALVSE